MIMELALPLDEKFRMVTKNSILAEKQGKRCDF